MLFTLWNISPSPFPYNHNCFNMMFVTGKLCSTFHLLHFQKFTLSLNLTVFTKWRFEIQVQRHDKKYNYINSLSSHVYQHHCQEKSKTVITISVIIKIIKLPKLKKNYHNGYDYNFHQDESHDHHSQQKRAAATVTLQNYISSCFYWPTSVFRKDKQKLQLQVNEKEKSMIHDHLFHNT